MGGREPIPFSIRGPISLQSIDNAADPNCRKAGGAIMEIVFQNPTQIGELTLTNYYTAWISIYVKRALAKNISTPSKTSATDASVRPRPHFERSISVDLTGTDYRNRIPHDPVRNDELFTLEAVHSNLASNPAPSRRRHSSGPYTADLSDKPWECCISMKALMPWPHFEAGCQDTFSIPATESAVELRDVFVMRIILYQPSTVWKRFSLEDVNVFRYLPKRGLSQTEDISRQREGWLATLRLNTKKMLGGQLVEADKYDSDEDCTKFRGFLHHDEHGPCEILKIQEKSASEVALVLSTERQVLAEAERQKRRTEEAEPHSKAILKESATVDVQTGARTVLLTVVRTRPSAPSSPRPSCSTANHNAR